MSPLQHLLFALCVALASYVQNLTGFAFGLLMLGLTGLLHIAPLPDVANIVSLLTLINAAALSRSARPSFDRRIMAPTLAAGLPGVLLGVLLLNWLGDNVLAGLRLLLGVAIVGCAALLLLDSSQRARRSHGATFAAVGLVSGVLGGLFSTAGPPLVYHFYRQPLDARAIRDALVAIFTVNAVLRIVLMAGSGRIGPDVFWLGLEAAPIVIAQTWWMARRPTRWSQAAIRRIACLLLAAVGGGLVVPSLRALA